MVDNKIIWDAFQVYEEAANRLKRRYELLGRISVICIGVSAIYASYRSFWGGAIWFRALDIPAVLLGGIGILLDIYIRWRNLKQRWLANRFAAERLRSVKFQLYALAAATRDRQELESAVRERAQAMVDQIEQDLLLPIGTLNAFHPRSAIDLSPTAALAGASPPANPVLLAQAIRDYREWRVKYQHVFAEQMGRDVAAKQRGYDSLSDALFVLGAAVLIVGFVVRHVSAGLADAAEFLEATGLAMFVWTAMAKVLSTGASHLANASRYQQYGRDVSRLMHVQPQDSAGFLALVEQMELLALRELDDFWRDAWISSYRS